ncbi:hypothetical protein V6Z11_A10G137600 [Gossypium hirsutum]
MLGSAWLGADFLKKICLEKEKSLFNSSKGKAAARWGKNWFKARLGLEFVVRYSLLIVDSASNNNNPDLKYSDVYFVMACT